MVRFWVRDVTSFWPVGSHLGTFLNVQSIRPLTSTSPSIQSVLHIQSHRTGSYKLYNVILSMACMSEYTMYHSSFCRENALTITQHSIFYFELILMGTILKSNENFKNELELQVINKVNDYKKYRLPMLACKILWAHLSVEFDHLLN